MSRLPAAGSRMPDLERKPRAQLYLPRIPRRIADQQRRRDDAAVAAARVVHAVEHVVTLEEPLDRLVPAKREFLGQPQVERDEGVQLEVVRRNRRQVSRRAQVVDDA